MFHSHVGACLWGRVSFVSLQCSNEAVTVDDGRGPVVKGHLGRKCPLGIRKLHAESSHVAMTSPNRERTWWGMNWEMGIDTVTLMILRVGHNQ